MRKIKLFLIGLGISLAIFGGFTFIENRKIIDQIQMNYATNQVMSVDFEQELKDALKSPFFTQSDKSFILGYLALNQEGNQDVAEDYFKEAISQKMPYENNISIIYSYKILSDLMLKEHKIDEAVEYAKSAFNQINSTEYNDSYKIIWDILDPLSVYEKGRDFSIEALEHVLEYRGVLESEPILFLTRNLAFLYAVDKNYTSAMEMNLRTIALSEKLDDFYAHEKALVDIAIIVRQIGGYEVTEEILGYIDASQIADDRLRVNLNAYKLINLAEVQVILKKYDEALDSLNHLQKYEPYLERDYLNEIQCLANLLMAEINVERGDLQKAEEYLNLVESYLSEEKSGDYVEKGVLYHLISGILHMEKLKYDEAIQFFELALTQLDEIPNNEYKLRCLDELAIVYEQLGDLSNAEIYKQQALNIKRSQINIFSTDYLKYIDYKLSYDTVVQEKFLIEIMTVIMGIFLVSILIILFKREFYPYLIKLINRKKVKNYLEKEKYFLVYQPIVNPKTSQVVGLEALLRLKVNDKVIMPSKSIKQIEDCDMMGEVTIWILKTIINDYDQIKMINQLKENFYISLNISLNEIEKDHICTQLKECFEQSNLSTNSICLEITERACGDNDLQIKQNLESLKECGFLLALDDFGVEYSNLSILGKFNFDIIKLDKYFIELIDCLKIHQTLMEIADYLSVNRKKSIVLEGVESEHQQQIIKNTKSEKIYVQGYFYSKPLEVQQLKDLVID